MPLEVYGDLESPVVKVFYSSVIELICAVHLLTDPAHHQYEIKWAEEMLSVLSEDELDALQSIKYYPAGGIEFLNYVLETKEHFSIERFINYIESTDETDFFFYLLNEGIDKDKIHKAFISKNERYKIQEKIKWIVEDNILMYFFDKPCEIKSKALKILKAIYEKGFQDRFQKNKDRLEDGVDYVNSFIDKDNIEMALEKVTGKPKKLFTGFKEYYIIPSYFVSPRLIRVYSDEKLYMVFDCRLTRDKKEALLEELSNMLKVIDDKSRMEILRILVNSKSYGKALSDMIGISTPTVSHHLEVLKQAGLIKEEKIRNIKYFYADKDQLKSIIDDINKYFFSAE
ncbi:ArsR/SmtB family transcription factor [Lutispora thermophila]|uniref:Regulatory protein, arsR family n=1 Tax=Lutispora thermophila DSM 19022 TaxID=1122184 RepID=A0A1M6CGT3_9FIRM|nr:winged helix-turn-helix domain-containing protein [Lutispora thermophila]SHI60133.1 regulatory protein, arsR family [Lutispora thermophila DSM 19022]